MPFTSSIKPAFKARPAITQLGEVAERRVDEPAGGRARVPRQLLRRVAEDAGQRNDRSGAKRENHKWRGVHQLRNDCELDEDK